jgi:hypothetical protein
MQSAAFTCFVPSARGEPDRWVEICSLILSSGAARSFELIGRTEPDTHLLKQVEQVTTSVWGRTDLAVRQNPDQGDHRGGRRSVFYLAIIDLADISLQKTAKTARRGWGRQFAKGQSGNTARPHLAVPRTGPLGLLSSCSPDQVDSYRNSVLLPKPDLLISGLDERTRARRH